MLILDAHSKILLSHFRMLSQSIPRGGNLVHFFVPEKSREPHCRVHVLHVPTFNILHSITPLPDRKAWMNFVRG